MLLEPRLLLPALISIHDPVLSLHRLFNSSCPCFCLLCAPFLRTLRTVICKVNSFLFVLFDDSLLESPSVDRFINRSLARSLNQYKHMDGIVTWLCSMSCAMENQARISHITAASPPCFCLLCSLSLGHFQAQLAE